MEHNPEILCSNVRGLNSRAKRDAVREFVASTKANIVCIQESKLDVVDQYTIMQCIGSAFDGFEYVPSVWTRGGIIVAWNNAFATISNVTRDEHALTGLVQPCHGEAWWITIVYGPQGDAAKLLFL